MAYQRRKPAPAQDDDRRTVSELGEDELRTLDLSPEASESARSILQSAGEKFRSLRSEGKINEAYAHLQAQLAANLGVLVGVDSLKGLLGSIMDIEEFLGKSKKDKGSLDISPLEALREFLQSDAPVDPPNEFDGKNLTVQ